MGARWVSENPDPTGQMVGHAIVASWIPTLYWVVMTCGKDTLQPGPMGTLLKSMGVKVLPYWTTVRRCDRVGRPKSTRSPTFVEHATLETAQAFHTDAVQRLTKRWL